jgi:hypothetical protein
MLNQVLLYEWLTIFAAIGGAVGFFVYLFKLSKFLFRMISYFWDRKIRTFLKITKIKYVRNSMILSSDTVLFLAYSFGRLYLILTCLIAVIASLIFITSERQIPPNFKFLLYAMFCCYGLLGSYFAASLWSRLMHVRYLKERLRQIRLKRARRR